MHYDQFSKANLTRCEAIDGFNHKLSAWSISDWLVAFVGEFGEMCNIQKKLNRVHSGIRGNREPTPDLVQKRRRELGDAGVYLDLIAQRMGFNLLDAMVEVFNLKSEELGYPVRIPIEGQLVDDQMPKDKPGQRVTFDYTNFRGDKSVRLVQPLWILFGVNEWHTEPQWLMVGYDVNKEAERTFAMKDIANWQPSP